MKDKNYKEIINDINKILNEICDDGRMKYHILPVVKISVEMAKELKADEQVVEIAAYLHDVTRILGDKENHHITGAKYARDFLEKYAFDNKKIELIEKCIKNHRGSTKNNRETTEEKIISIIKNNFDLTPDGIINYLNLREPIYSKTTNYGHFGKDGLSYEKIIKLEI